MTKLQISRDQARHFASSIYTDIKRYIDDHKEEFEKFLQNENIKINRKNQAS